MFIYSILYIFFCIYLRGKVGYRPAVRAHRSPGSIEITESEVGEFHFSEAVWVRQKHVVQLHVAVTDMLIVCVAYSADDLSGEWVKESGSIVKGG